MLYRFASFEVDEEKHELRLDGSEVPLQPLVFKLLLHLIRHRDRVVGKAELLRSLWQGAIVTDASLQRAVSLARSALRTGDAANAIRTYSREGYRFCLDVRVLDSLSTTSPESTEDRCDHEGSLSAARAASDRGEWQEAAQQFTRADSHEALGASDLERWAYAAQCAGRQEEAIPPLERAVAAHSARGERRGAARAALSLAGIHFERCQSAVAGGWHRRAARFLAGEDTASEHGHLEWLASRFAAASGDIEEALEHAKRAHELGRALGDTDLEVLGLLYWGLASLATGNVAEGVGLHDEAAAATLAGRVGPLVGGLVYCGVIWSCRNRYDWDRAAQWTEHFTRWCAKRGVDAYPGTCRLHRAEVLCVRGELTEAESEVAEATTLLSRSAPWAEGEAHRVLGDIRLARGELDGAEDAYRRAYELGWDPQPGRAMLEVARGQARQALHGLERSLKDPAWSNRQRRGLLLAHRAIAAVAAGDTACAQEALDDLDARPELWSTPALAAIVARARADLALSAGTIDEAVQSQRSAVQLWQDAGSSVNVASARLRLAELLLAAGETEGARLELSLAESAFERLRADRKLQSCAELRRAHGLEA